MTTVKWPHCFPRITIGKEKATISTFGYVIPGDTVLLKCGLCKSAVPQDDFQEHCAWHSTLRHTSIEAVEELIT